MKAIITTLCLSLIFLISCNHKHESRDKAREDHAHAYGETGDHDHYSHKGNSNVDYDAKLKELDIELNKPSPPVANYVNITRSGKLLFLAGKGPSKPEGGYITGKVGRDLTVEEGYAAAQLAGIAQLSVLKDHLGDLNKVKRILKVKGMVNATPDFTNHPEVINGYSDMMVSVFGEKGKHARAAVGMGSLPRNIAVEIEMIVETY